MLSQRMRKTEKTSQGWMSGRILWLDGEEKFLAQMLTHCVRKRYPLLPVCPQPPADSILHPLYLSEYAKDVSNKCKHINIHTVSCVSVDQI